MGEPDEVDGREARPTGGSGLTLLGLLGGAIVAAVLLGQLTSPDPSPPPRVAVAATNPSHLATGPAPDKPIGVESLRRCPVPMGGLTLGDQMQVRGSTVERWDCDALNGPWSLVIRATRGHFGINSAVVTYPAEDKGSGVTSTKPEGGIWNPGSQTLLFPLGTSHGQIVGDLGQTTLENLAMRITAEGGKPRFQTLDGFAATAAIPYGSPVVHEMRYGAVELGQRSALGDGLVFTGVTWGASFESLAFESRAKAAGLVRGTPAIYFTALVGSGALAWESAPGEVTYVGYSSTATESTAFEGLRALADKGRMLTPAQWETKDRYSVAARSG